MAASPPPAPRPASRAQLAAWALYDWANSPFFALIVTFVFARYFVDAVAADPITGTAQWGWALTVSGLGVAVLSPVLGAIADAGGPRKPWLLALTAAAALATAGLWWVEPAPASVGLALGLLIVALTAAELGQSFYNAMLPDLAPPDRLGRWSGWGWGLGYLAGIAALALLLALFIRPDPSPLGLDRGAAEHVRAVGPFVAIWLALFALPLFLAVPDRPSAGLAPARAARDGLARLGRTLRELRGDRNLVRFLVARLVYNDGLNTLFAFGGIYAAGTFGMGADELILFGLALNGTAGLGAFGFARVDDRRGSKAAILLAIAGLLASGLAALLVTGKGAFWVAGVLLGLFIGPVQSASRTLMARLSPPDRLGEFFGLYALTGKVTSFVGPLLFGTATVALGTQRAGMAVVLLMLGLGALLLLGVREPARAEVRP